MTHREDFVAPRCPVCEEREDVQRAVNAPTPWICFACWTTFWGGQDEWDRMGPQRKQWANQKQRAAENEEGKG